MKRVPLKRTEFKRKRVPGQYSMFKKRSSRLANVSKQRPQKRRQAKEFYRDCEGTDFHEVRGSVLAESVRDWPKIRRVDLPELRNYYRNMPVAQNCACCGIHRHNVPNEQLDVHHLTGGSKGRSDEFTNFLALCRKCHERFQSQRDSFGYLLWLKFNADAEHTNWRRLTLLHGRWLPELMTAEPRESPFPLTGVNEP